MRLCNTNKGQAILESAITMNIILVLFMAMLMYSVFLYDKMIVLFASNIALDEGIAKISNPSITDAQLEDLMKQKASSALKLSMFIDDNAEFDCVVTKKSDNTGFIRAGVSAKLSINLPLVSQFLPENRISHISEIDYSWN